MNHASDALLLVIYSNTASNNQTNGDVLAVTDPVVRNGRDCFSSKSWKATASLPLPVCFLFFSLSWFTLIRHAKWVFTVGEASARGAGRHQSIGEKSLHLISLGPDSSFSSSSGSYSGPLCPGNARSEFTQTFPRWAAFTPCQYH